MATITYQCSVCKRNIDLLENKKGLTTFSRCVITDGCRGKMIPQSRNIDNARETFPKDVPNLENKVFRKSLFNYTQLIPSNIWNIEHDMNTFPAVSVYTYDSNNNLQELPVENYTIILIDSNTIKLVLNSSIVGVAQLLARSSNNVTYSPSVPILNPIQVTANGMFTFAVPKFLTHYDYPPSIVNSLPDPLEGSPIRMEISLTRPGKEEEICTEKLSTSFVDNAWAGWDEILVRKRRNYYLFTKKISDFRTLGGGGNNTDFEQLADGTQLKILRIDYGTGVFQPLESDNFIMLLTNSPYTINDKVRDKIVDIGDMYAQADGYFSYKSGDFIVSQKYVDKTYPNIMRVNTPIFPSA